MEQLVMVGPNRPLAGRRALVTGGASGIGFAVAQRFVDAGACVTIGDLNAGAGEAAAARLGSSCAFARLDVVSEASVDAAMSAAEASFGPIDILVHSAGVGIERPFLDTTLDEWRRIIDIDLTGAFLCARAAGRRMKAQGHGRIITLASTAAVRGGVGRAAYGAAKGGVVTLTKVIAVELAPFGVTANAIAPGAIETELVAKMHSPETRKVYTAAIPIGRYGLPDEVADAALFLARDEARYLTGHVLAVDGGFLAAGLMPRR
jgi:3-oxoacyl-[acyl-carrier protein] reductase